MTRIRVCILLLVALLAAPQISFVSQAAAAKDHKAVVADNLRPFLKDGAASIPVLIEFASRPEQKDLDLLLKAGFTGPFIRFEILPVVSASGSAGAIKSILGNKRVVYVQHDAPLELKLDRATKVSRAADVWDAQYTADGVNLQGITGKGVGVAVIDSGIDATHPDLMHHSIANRLGVPAKTTANLKMLDGRVVRFGGAAAPLNEFLEAANLAVDMPDTDTTGGHGTHVAGIVGGNGRASNGKYMGAAPGANLIGFGAGEGIHVLAALASFDWIHQNHESYNIRVINNSWGGDPAEMDPNDIYTRAVRTLVNEDGIVVVFAASNDGGTGHAVRTSPTANIPEAISVANYYDRYGWLTGSSSRGAKAKPETWPDLAAPGTQIISTAAQGKPVTFVCTGQDALIDEGAPLIVPSEVPDSEPTVIPAPLPTAVETDLVDGEGEVIGNYASCTGTSMAAPHVAGVVALMLEANSKLKPAEVEDILTATANMVPGRNFEEDGYGIGAGVVDAAEAVAVALKMRDGLSLHDALRLAYVNYNNSGPAQLNKAEPRNIEITSPGDGTQLSGSTVTVRGTFNAGLVTDNSIPVAPAPPPRERVGSSPNIYHLGAFQAQPPDRPIVARGELVELSNRFIQSRDPDLALSLGSFQGTHRVRGPGGLDLTFDASESADGTTTDGRPRFQTNNEWTIPASAPVGEYLFEGWLTIVATGEVLPLRSLEFFVQGVPPSAGMVEARASAPRARAPIDAPPEVDLPGLPLQSSASDSFYQNNFESGNNGWTVRQNGTANTGPLTTWQFLNPGTVPVRHTPRSTGARRYYVGLTQANAVNGLTYTDNANVSLLSPPISLATATAAELSYWRAGESEYNFDFLTVYAAKHGTEDWKKVDQVSGDPRPAELDGNGHSNSWHQAKAELPAELYGENIWLRFNFTSDTNLSTPFQGWYIDDISITGTGGGIPRPPDAPAPPQIVPRLRAEPSFGVGSLDSTLHYSVTSTARITKVELDYGDGSKEQVFTASATTTSTTVSGSRRHRYNSPGYYKPRVTATVEGGHFASAEDIVDVAPVNVIQVRIDGLPWVSAGSALSADRNWSAVLNLAGLPAGKHTIRARHCDSNAHCIHDSVEVIKIEPPITINALSVNEGAGTANVTARLREASGSPVTATYTTIDGTAKAGLDYTAVTGTLNFLPGQTTKTIAVPITNDTLYEGNETFKVVATDHLGRTSEGVVTIVSNDPTPRMSISDKTVSEGEAGLTPAHLTVSLANPSAFPFKVNYATRNGTAVAGTDYQAATGTVTFNPGETSKIITVNVIGDVIDENNETFFVDLSAPNGGVIADGTGQVTIFDEDGSTTPLSTSSWWSRFVDALTNNETARESA